jgi:hypothetical protein
MPDLALLNYLPIVVAVGRNLLESVKLALHRFQHQCAHLMEK